MIHIVTDTTSGLPQAVAASYAISVVPQVVLFGEESLLEGVDIDQQTFMERLVSSKTLPKTAAPPPGLFVEIFQQRAGPGNTILCLHPSAEVSGTVRSALTAKEEFPTADIRVLDTRTIVGPLASLVLQAAQWAAEGADADVIWSRVQEMMGRSHIYFLVDTLEYLQKGGRIGGAAALVGSLLQIKPILELRDGRVEPLERERTHRRALARLKELVLARSARGADAHLSVFHAAAPEQAGRLAAELGEALDDPHPMIVDLPPAVTTHVGPGTLGVGFFATAD
jgi:DegV family protein with EDD domain